MPCSLDQYDIRSQLHSAASKQIKPPTTRHHSRRIRTSPHVMYYSMWLLAAAAFASEGLTCFNCGYANSGTYGTQGWPKVTS